MTAAEFKDVKVGNILEIARGVDTGRKVKVLYICSDCVLVQTKDNRTLKAHNAHKNVVLLSWRSVEKPTVRKVAKKV